MKFGNNATVSFMPVTPRFKIRFETIREKIAVQCHFIKCKKIS